MGGPSEEEEEARRGVTAPFKRGLKNGKMHRISRFESVQLASTARGMGLEGK